MTLVTLASYPQPANCHPACPGMPRDHSGGTTDGTALVRRAIQNREDAAKTHRPLRYLLRKIDDHRDTTKDIIETEQGNVARLIAIHNQPLTPEANQAELDRLHTLAHHPEIQEHRHRREQKDATRVNRLMRLLPDAFPYHDQGTTPCPAGAAQAGQAKPPAIISASPPTQASRPPMWKQIFSTAWPANSGSIKPRNA